MTIDEVRAEVLLLNIENIKKYPITHSLREDFYNMWQRFGPEAARTYMITHVYNGDVILPSEVFRGR